MPLYNVLLPLGGFFVLFAISDGIWNAIASRARKSAVPRWYYPRVFVFGAGLLLTTAGIVLLGLALT